MALIPSDGKFTQEDVADLRSELIRSGLDNWQAAELITSFLSARGYGVSTEGARHMACQLDSSHISIENMHRELEMMALPM